MKILIDKKHPIGSAFVAIKETGEFLVGRVQSSAKEYASATEAYNYYYNLHVDTNSHSCWNICSHLEDYFLAERDA